VQEAVPKDIKDPALRGGTQQRFVIGDVPTHVLVTVSRFAAVRGGAAGVECERNNYEVLVNDISLRAGQVRAGLLPD
jgi:hypothetical protein